MIASRTLIPGVSGSPVLNSHQPAFQRLHRCDNWDSPYGDLIVDLPVEGSAGTLHVKPHNTLAFFYHAARCSLMFFDFMSGLILRRGTKAGSFEAIRITLCEFPHWLRTRKGLRWIPLCYPKHDETEAPKVTVSNIVTADPTVGSIVMLSHQGHAPVVLQMRFEPMPQDADAFKHVFSLTGSSGQSPCPWCSNCPGSPGLDSAAIVLIVGRKWLWRLRGQKMPPSIHSIHSLIHSISFIYIESLTQAYC